VRTLAIALACAGCSGGGDTCGPTRGVVARAIDGDTIELETGETIRYLLVDTPESTGGNDDCFGANAAQFNADLVVGEEVELSYDVECTDRFGRLLAYASLGGDPPDEINRLMIERGYACVLHIPPNGAEVVDEYLALEEAARDAGRGLWGSCLPEEILCD
jgi:micrococcal nuclease